MKLPRLAVVLLATGLIACQARGAAPVRITANSASSTGAAIATGIDGDTRIVWTDTRDGNNEIYYALVDGFGNRLTPDVRVTNSPAASSNSPAVGVDGQGSAYVCWREGGNAWVAKLDRLGQPLVASHAVSLGFSYVIALGPDLSVQADGRFAVGFGAQHSGLDDMFIVNFDAGLNKTCQTTNLYTNLTWLDAKVSVRTSGNLNALLAWQQVGFLDGDNLATVGSAVSCSRGPVNYLCSGNTFSGVNIHGAGLLYVRSNHIFLAGTGCGAQLSENPGPSRAPAGDTLTSSRSIAVWEDGRAGNSDLYYAVYAHSGLAKVGVDTALITGPSQSQAPAVSTDRAGTAFVAWQDDRDGNSEIYFTRIPDLSASRGTITGTVFDAITLAPIPGAVVTLIGPQRPPASRDYIAGADGKYRISGLVPGPYALSASSAGHVSPLISGRLVSAGSSLVQDLYVSTGTTLEGGVSDSFSGLAIAGARLHLVSNDGQYVRDTQTDPEGRYHLDLPAGTYSLQASVPALGTPGPYFSPTNDLYHAKLVPNLVVTSDPAQQPFSLETNTVLFAHGILSDASSWGVVQSPAGGDPVMRSEVELGGFHTEAIDRDWTRSIPDQASELQRWFAHQPYKSARVVAHSMGGLASRWYIERTPVDGGSARIPLLITLGTPNHGAPAADIVSDILDALVLVEAAKKAVVFRLDMTRIEFETKLLQTWPFLQDLRPNAANLDILNYGDPDRVDMIGEGACLAHDPEQVPTSTSYLAIAGDSPQWLTPLWAVAPCSSDGVVPVASAVLYKPAAPQQIQSIRTGCLMDPVPTGDCGSSHFSWMGSVDYKRSYCVSKNVVQRLNGATLTPACGSIEPAVAAADTQVEQLRDIDHLMAPGTAAVDSFLVETGSYLGVRVRWLRGGVTIALRSPDGTVIDSAATSGNPGQLYISDYGSLYARLDVAGAQAGWWRLTTMLVSDSVQQVSVRPFTSGSVTLSASVQHAQATPGAGAVIVGTLKTSGSPLPGAVVTAEIRDPGSNASAIVLHDDGIAPDLTAADGIYTGSFAGTAAPGRYLVSVRASGGTAPPYAPRQAMTAFEVATPTNIVLGAGDLTYGQLWAYPSDALPFTVTVHNLASVVADSVWLLGRDDSTGVAFLDTVVTIPAASSLATPSRFSATRLGRHPLSFFATPLGGAPDVASNSHHTTRTAEIVAFGSAPVFVSVDPPPTPRFPRYLPTRVLPNPSRGEVRFEFFLSRAARGTRLTVTDAAGRLVGTVDAGPLDAGWRSVAWSPREGNDRRLEPGVYFYRIESAELRGQGRFVVVR